MSAFFCCGELKGRSSTIFLQLSTRGHKQRESHMDRTLKVLGVFAVVAFFALGALYYTGNLHFGSAGQSSGNQLAGGQNPDATVPAPEPAAGANNPGLKTGKAPVTGESVLAAWNRAVKETPPPAGAVAWKPIEAQATGETGCTPGETRVNPTTGRLQGCK